MLLQIVSQKFYRNVSGVDLYKPLSKSLILIGCHGNRNFTFSKTIFKNLLLRSHKGDEAETLHKCLCYYALHKLCFLLLLGMWFCCHRTLNFHGFIMGKVKVGLYFYLTRYFDKSFTVMFLE